MSKEKHYESPRWSREIPDCSMPMTFDTYSNCSFGCLYCFSQFQRAIGGSKTDYLARKVRSVSIDKIKRMFLNPQTSQFQDFIKNKKVMQWGGLSDPFCFFEKKMGVTLELLKFFRDIEYPLCFSTKATWWLDDKRYTDVFSGANNWNCKFSIITLDKNKALHVEKGVPVPLDRLKAIEKYSKLNNGGATLRLRPFIIGISDPSYTNLIKSAADAGATALSTEFFCMELRTPTARKKYEVLSDVAGYDMVAFYKKYSYGSGYLRLNRNVKRPYVNEMERICKEKGVRFYVSDAHFKERCHNSSCCGLPDSWNYSKGQFCEALMIAKKNGIVRWSDFSTGLQYAAKFEWGRAQGYNASSSEQRAKFFGMTMYDYLRWAWNTPSSGQSPYVMFEGILKPSGKDINGDCIYVYDKTRE